MPFQLLDGIEARGQTLRRVKRIANVLFRHGFEVFVEKTPLAPLVTPDCRAEVEAACRCKEEKGTCPCGHALPLPERVVNIVVELGPTFIKLGQIASTRPDLVPREYTEPLRSLQEDVPPFPFKQVKQIIEEELKWPVEKAFRSIGEKPIASASLSQVHFAELADGTPVAIKVQRPGIREIIEQDLVILRWLARQVARLYPGVRNLHAEAAVEEFGRWTLKELDFRVEGHNYEEFRRNFADRDDIVFPKVYWDHTSMRCLTMERVAGMRIHEVAEGMHPHERKRLAQRLAEIELQMLITHGFFHADLHPGNIFFTADGRIVILDVGMVGRISSQLQDRFLCYWVAIERNQRERALYHFLKMALSTEGADLDQFRQRYDAILDKFYGVPVVDRSMAQTYLDILLSAAACNVIMPAEMMLQAKAVITAEALDLVLFPDFKFTEEARPIVARELAKRATPRRILDRVWSGLAEFILLGESPPAGRITTNDKLDERRFRREVLKALAYVWADETDSKLREKRADLDRYTSASYWTEHREIHAVMQTAMGLLRLFSMQMNRGQYASWQEQTSLWQEASVTQGRDTGDPDDGKARFRAFQEVEGMDDRHGKGRPWTTDAGQLAAYWEAKVRDFPAIEFWEDEQIFRSALKNGLAILGLLASQAAQAIDAKQRENEAADSELSPNAKVAVG